MTDAVQSVEDELRVWEGLPAGVLLLDPQGSALYLNPWLAELAEQRPGPSLGRGWQRWLAPASLAATLRALGARASFALDWQLQAAGRPSRWLAGDAQWRADAGHYLCVLHDVTPARQAEASAQAKAQQLQLLADNVPVLIAYFRASDHRCLFANKLYARTFGFDEHSVLGLSVREIIGEAAQREIQPHVDRVLRDRVPVSYERQLVDGQGQPRWIEVDLLPHLDAQGEAAAAFVLISDITRHRLAERALRESEERFAKFMQASAEGIVFHSQGIITDANPPLCELVGYRLDELLGRRAVDFIAPDQVERVSEVIRAGVETRYESALLHRDGRRIPVEFIVRMALRDGERMRMTVVRDIRDRQAAQARIHHLAHHDPLTGLPNRAAFIERLEQLIAMPRQGDALLALLFIDLDHFKRVNDSLGHLAGDRLLQTVAARITACLRSTDLVSRFGGDEFLVLLAEQPSRRAIEEVARKLLLAIEAPIDADGCAISVTPSVGIALHPDHAGSSSELIRHADAAMYRAKSRGRATVQFHDPDSAMESYRNLVLEGELAQAVQRGEFLLHYQPQVRARDGVLVGAEALIRWQHPQRGLIGPDDFIPLAEQRRLMLPIGQWVLSEAVRCARRWQDGPLAGVPVAVNLSSLQFQAADFVDGVRRVLDEHGLPGSLLELELTERMLMTDLASVKETLAPLKALGIRISVDDFGTGYSSLGHLKELPIDKLKVDHSFVRDLPEQADSAAIARAIIQMGRSLGLTVIAEGVERPAQRDFLCREGCDVLQGSNVGASLPGPAFERHWGAVAAARPDDAEAP